MRSQQSTHDGTTKRRGHRFFSVTVSRFFSGSDCGGGGGMCVREHIDNLLIGYSQTGSFERSRWRTFHRWIEIAGVSRPVRKV